MPARQTTTSWTLLLLAAVSAAGDVLAENLDRASVDRLVRQLASPSPLERKQAEDELSSADPETLDALPASTRDPEVSRALDRIRRAQEQAASKRVGLASAVSLRGELAPRDIEAAFLKQTGQAVLLGNAQRDSLDVDWQDISFWEAVHQLERRTKTYAGGDRFAAALILRPVAAGAAQQAVGSSGPCRVEIVAASRRENLVDPSKDLVQVRWRVRSEPRLRPLYLITADREAALKDGPTSLPALSPDARREIPCDRWEGCEIDTSFQSPKNLEMSILRFQVDATLKVAALPLKLQFDDLHQPEPASQRRGSVTGQVRDVRADMPTRTLALDLAVAYARAGPEFESHRMWIYQNAGWLEQKSGGTIVTPVHVELKEIGVAGVTLRYEFENVPGGLDGLRFIYEAPSLLVDVPVSVKGLAIAGAQ